MVENRPGTERTTERMSLKIRRVLQVLLVVVRAVDVADRGGIEAVADRDVDVRGDALGILHRDLRAVGRAADVVALAGLLLADEHGALVAHVEGHDVDPRRLRVQAARGLGADDVAGPVAQHVGLADVLAEERAEQHEHDREEEQRRRPPSARRAR